MTPDVLGLGGVFFRARDPAKVLAWYTEHFDLPAGDGHSVWQPSAGPLVFSPFPADTDYFGDRDRGFMLNFRVRDLDAFLARLAAAGITPVKPVESMDGIGRFSWVEDPEGNRVELWEPAAGLGD